jgi:hypothetical protein
LTLRTLALNPRFWMWLHGINVLRWLVLAPIAMIWWRDSVPFLLYVSLDTVVMGSVIGYCTALAARKADPDDPL